MYLDNMMSGQQCTDRTVEALIRTSLYLDTQKIQTTEGWDVDDGSSLDLSSRLARVKVATDMQKRGRGFILKALVEDWNHQTLLRELY